MLSYRWTNHDRQVKWKYGIHNMVADHIYHDIPLLSLRVFIDIKTIHSNVRVIRYICVYAVYENTIISLTSDRNRTTECVQRCSYCGSNGSDKQKE
jgi:hypothetical protein